MKGRCGYPAAAAAAGAVVECCGDATTETAHGTVTQAVDDDDKQ